MDNLIIFLIGVGFIFLSLVVEALGVRSRLNDVLFLGGVILVFVAFIRYATSFYTAQEK